MTEPNVIAAMYGNSGDGARTVQDIVKDQKQPLKEESYIEKREKYVTIKIDGKQVTVPSEKFVKDLEKKNGELEKKLKNVDTENRRLKASINQLINDLNKLKTKVDNKMDKL